MSELKARAVSELAQGLRQDAGSVRTRTVADWACIAPCAVLSLGICFSTLTDTKTLGCSSPLHEMFWCLYIIYMHSCVCFKLPLDYLQYLIQCE